jgi:secondary thiamine-phosphate synthase enzyme
MAGWEVLEVTSSRRVEIVDVTPQLTAVCGRAPRRDGLLIAVCGHTTAGLIVNEAESRLLEDLQGALERLVPQGQAYAHNAVDDNADAHLRAILLGHSVCVPVESGRPVLGTWQRILLVELDGPRRRTVRAGVWP